MKYDHILIIISPLTPLHNKVEKPVDQMPSPFPISPLLLSSHQAIYPSATNNLLFGPFSPFTTPFLPLPFIILSYFISYESSDNRED